MLQRELNEAHCEMIQTVATETQEITLRLYCMSMRQTEQ